MNTIKVIIGLAVLFTVLAKKPTCKELSNYSFDEYITDFGLNYQPNTSEYENRKQLFLSELSRVQLHNSKNLSWKEGINQFSALTKEEKQVFYGRSKGVAKTHQPKHEKSIDLNMKKIHELPSSKDWRESGVVSAVKDQGYCGSCWAFAATATLESHAALSTGLLYDFSVEQVTSCTPNPDSCGGYGGCAGATAELAFDYISGSVGITQEYQVGYKSYYGSQSCATVISQMAVVTFDGYVHLPKNNYTALLNAVATVGPVAINVDASTWGAYESGIFNGCNQASPDVNHVVVAVGYGEENGQKYWLVRNSWSPSWGEKGFIRVARLDNEEEACGLDVTPQDGVSCASDADTDTVCGTCGVIYDSSYPVGAALK